MKKENDQSATVPKLTNPVSLKNYYMDLFAAKMNKASEDELIKMSLAWGRSNSDAISDIDRVDNLYEAVNIFLEKALSEQTKPSNK